MWERAACWRSVREVGSFFCAGLSHIASVVKKRGLTARSVLAMV